MFFLQFHEVLVYGPHVLFAYQSIHTRTLNAHRCNLDLFDFDNLTLVLWISVGSCMSSPKFHAFHKSLFVIAAISATRTPCRQKRDRLPMTNAQVAEGISAMLSSNLNHRQCPIFCCWTCPSTFTLAGDDSEDLTSALRVSEAGPKSDRISMVECMWTTTTMTVCPNGGPVLPFRLRMKRKSLSDP